MGAIACFKNPKHLKRYLKVRYDKIELLGGVA